VYLEKPLALSAEDGAAILRAWRRRGTIGTIGFNYRCNPLYEEAGRLVRAGVLGVPRLVRSTFSTASRASPAGTEPAPGGVLADLGSHHFDLVPLIAASPVVEVIARVESPAGGHETAAVTMTLESGAVCQCFFSRAAVEADCLQVVGDRGALFVDRYRSLAPAVTSISPRRVHEALAAVCRVSGVAHLWRKRRAPWHEPSFEIALRRFLAAVGGAANVTPGLDAGWTSLQVALAASRSAILRSAVPVEGVEPVNRQPVPVR
jgi:predicted dehydrogenase